MVEIDLENSPLLKNKKFSISFWELVELLMIKLNNYDGHPEAYKYGRLCTIYRLKSGDQRPRLGSGDIEFDSLMKLSQEEAHELLCGKMKVQFTPKVCSYIVEKLMYDFKLRMGKT